MSESREPIPKVDGCDTSSNDQPTHATGPFPPVDCHTRRVVTRIRKLTVFALAISFSSGTSPLNPASLLFHLLRLGWRIAPSSSDHTTCFSWMVISRHLYLHLFGIYVQARSHNRLLPHGIFGSCYLGDLTGGLWVIHIGLRSGWFTSLKMVIEEYMVNLGLLLIEFVVLLSMRGNMCILRWWDRSCLGKLDSFRVIF